MLQQQLNQTQAQNQQLQTTIAQQSTTINLLGQQLASANSTAQTYQGLALVAVIIAVALAAFAGFTYYKRSTGKDQGANPKASQHQES
jgi:phage shock protein A